MAKRILVNRRTKRRKQWPANLLNLCETFGKASHEITPDMVRQVIDMSIARHAQRMAGIETSMLGGDS